MRHRGGVDPVVGTTINGCKILERIVRPEENYTVYLRYLCTFCNTELVGRRGNILRKGRKGCGCSNRAHNVSHGMTGTNEYCLWAGAKDRAKSKGIEFTLEVGDIAIPSHCPVLGIPLEALPRGERNQRLRNTAPSLDRWDNSIGYTKENVRVISHKANVMKSDLTLETLDRLRLYMEGKL